MSSDPLATLEQNRLAALNVLDILDTAPEPAFDRIAAAARAAFDAPVAILGFLDEHRHWFKAKEGVELTQSPRSVSFCTHAIRQDGVMWVADALEDPRFADSPLVAGGPRVRFYAGAPMTGDDGERVGTVCILDMKPRPFDPRLADLLTGFAQMGTDQLELRRHRRMRKVVGNLIGTTSDAMICADREGRINLWNTAAVAMFGWTSAEAVGRGLEFIIPDRLKAGHQAGFARFIGGGAPVLIGRSIEVPGLHKDGREITIELTLSAWGSGEDRGVGAVIRDVSERKAAEDELRRTRAEAETAGRETAAAHDTMGLLVRSATTALVMTDAQLRVLEVSDRWTEQYGISRDVVLGRGMHEVFPDGRERWDSVYRRCLAGEREGGESSSDTTSGSEGARWFRWEVAPWRDGAGAVAGLLLTNHEVTDLVHAKEAAELQQRRLGLAMEIADLVVWEADFHGQALHVHGGDPEALFGHPISFADLARDGFLIIHPDDKHRAQTAWDLHVDQGRPYRVEHRLPRADREVWVSSSVELVRGPDGRAKGVLGVLTDITGRKSLEQEMRRAHEAAEAANRSKTEFLANMSHEVRTPLNGVIGLAAALSSGRLAPEQAEMVRMLQQSGDELEHMLTSVLDLVQLEAGHGEAERQPFDPLAVLTDAGAQCAAAARRKGLKLEVDRPETIIGGLGDAARVRRILDQLLDNAVKFTAEGSVRLSLAQLSDEGRVRTVFTVRDTGVGFDDHDAERLFERFQQADGGATRRFGGSGLGLALCRALAESMDGRIEARSRPGLGATFELVLDLEPLAAQEFVSAA